MRPRPAPSASSFGDIQQNIHAAERFRPGALLWCTLLLVGFAHPLAAQRDAAGEALDIARNGDPDSALTLLAGARAADPENLDLQLAHARVLGWAGRRSEAESVFDSILVRSPANADAMVGLGYVYHWQGREGPAMRQAKTALALDSTNADAWALRRAVHTAARASMESSANWSNDSDHNTNFWQTHSVSAPLTDGLRLLAAFSVLEASDPLRESWRYGGEGGLGWALGQVSASAWAGARRLEPGEGGARTAATYRGSLNWAPDGRIGIGIGYARYPFDETALLIGLGLDVESLEGGLDLHPAGGLALAGSATALWVSDGNRRTEARAGVTQEIGRNFVIGANGRALGYREVGFGYFSPDRFHLLEGTLTLKDGNADWDARLGGGLGAQQIGRNGDMQTEWHIDARVGRKWGDGNSIEGYGGVTNSAVSSTTGAFRYRTAGLLLRLGL